MIIIRMLVHNITISINASPGLSKLKNKKLQMKFKTIWTVNISRALLRFVPFAEFQIINREIPIKAKSVVQTGAKMKLGGLKDGLISVTYQVLMAEEVKKPERPPIAKGINRQIKRDGKYFNSFIINDLTYNYFNFWRFCGSSLGR
jgi:hypothetical protein